MPQSIVYLDEAENRIIEDFAKKMELSKAESIKTMIRFFDTAKFFQKLKEQKEGRI